MVRCTHPGSEAAQNTMNCPKWRRTIHAWPHYCQDGLAQRMPCWRPIAAGRAKCTALGVHGQAPTDALSNTFSNPHNKPEWTIQKLLCNRSINGNHLWKVCPFGEPLFYNSSAHSHHPISWAVPWTLDCGASCSHGPQWGAQGGCVFREQFVLWNRFRLPGWLYLLRMVIIRTEKHLLLILKHPLSYEVGVKSASSH